MKRSRKRRKRRGRGGTPKTKRKTFDLQQHRKAMAGLKKEIDQNFGIHWKSFVKRHILIPQKESAFIGWAAHMRKKMMVILSS